MQLSAYEPLAGLAVMESQSLLFNTIRTFRTKCIEGIKVNEPVLARNLEETVGIVTALDPVKLTGLDPMNYKAMKAAAKRGCGCTRHKGKHRGERQHRHGPREANMRSTWSCFVALLVVALAVPAFAQVPAAKPRVVILATGGTIAGAAASETSAGYSSGAVAVDTLIAAVPQMNDLAVVTGEQIASLGSQDMNDEVWVKLAARTNVLLASKDVDGVVITHGTDTLEETSYFLHLVVKSVKPVVMTGSMRPSTAISADGPLNIYNAVAIAADPQSWGRGVLVAVNDDIHSAHDLIKTHTTDVETFTSNEPGLIGVTLFGKQEYYRTPGKLHTARTDFTVTAAQKLPRVDIIYAHANMSPDLIDAAVANGAKGLVIAGVGDGNMASPALEAVKRAVAKSVIVVRSSRTGRGIIRRNIEINDDQLGTVASMDLNPGKARVLLQLALIKTSDVKKIQDYFEKY